MPLDREEIKERESKPLNLHQINYMARMMENQLNHEHAKYEYTTEYDQQPMDNEKD